MCSGTVETSDYDPYITKHLNEGRCVDVGCGYVYSDAEGWAEIIEESVKEDVKPQEPKAGDMVEYSDDGENWEDLLRYTGGRTTSGFYIVEENDVTLCFNHIRLPEVDKSGKKVRELFNESYGNHVPELTDNLREFGLKCIEWGRNNPKKSINADEILKELDLAKSSLDLNEAFSRGLDKAIEIVKSKTK
jgi:hypothetical protein